MKKFIFLSLLAMLVLQSISVYGAESTSEDLAYNPSEEYIIDCLEACPNILDIVAVTEGNDPNNKLNTENGYYSAVFFSVDLIEQDKIYGDELIDKGTDAGGCIEAYKMIEDAEARNEYLSKFDNAWIFNAGYHTVIGTVVIRTSKELSEDEHSKLENNIVKIITNRNLEEVVYETENLSVTKAEQDETETLSEKKADKRPKKIAMPYSSEEYIEGDWDIDSITEHFSELGFTNICAVPCDPDDTDYMKNIFEMYIEKGWFSKDPWKKGEEFKANKEITIYYNAEPMLTVENCPDFFDLFTDTGMDYMTFCEKYDGRYVKFDGYIIYNHTYYAGRIMEVAGGDYDGVTEIDPYDPTTYLGPNIRIGDRSLWKKHIETEVDIGEEVVVSGKIDASWADYFDCMYVETLILDRR